MHGGISNIQIVAMSTPNSKNRKAVYREAKALIKVSLDTDSHLKNLDDSRFSLGRYS